MAVGAFVRAILHEEWARHTGLPALGRLPALERQDARRHQGVVEVLELTRLPRQLLAAGKGHHVDAPDVDGGDGLVHLGELPFNLRLNTGAIHEIDENQGPDAALRKELGGTGPECAVGAGDQGRPARIGLGRHRRPGVLLCDEAAPREVFRKEQGNSPRKEDRGCGNNTANYPKVGHSETTSWFESTFYVLQLLSLSVKLKTIP